jgi:hypothetical protein
MGIIYQDRLQRSIAVWRIVQRNLAQLGSGDADAVLAPGVGVEALHRRAVNVVTVALPGRPVPVIYFMGRAR